MMPAIRPVHRSNGEDGSFGERVTSRPSSRQTSHLHNCDLYHTRKIHIVIIFYFLYHDNNGGGRSLNTDKNTVLNHFVYPIGIMAVTDFIM